MGDENIARQLDKMEDHLLTLAEKGEDVALDLARIQGSRRTLGLKRGDGDPKVDVPKRKM